jgi:hypothetical protein
MNIGDAIEQAKLQVRRDTWLKPDDWRVILNAVCMEFATQTGILEDDFELTMAENVAEYDLSNVVNSAGLYVGLMAITEKPFLAM